MGAPSLDLQCRDHLRDCQFHLDPLQEFGEPDAEPAPRFRRSQTAPQLCLGRGAAAVGRGLNTAPEPRLGSAAAVAGRGEHDWAWYLCEN